MRYGYKVWHSEEHKSGTMERDGRSLNHHEISVEHLHVAAQAGLQYRRDARFKVSVKVLEPAARGLMVVLDTEHGEDEADRSIANFLVALNAQDVNLCLIAEPLPPAPTPTRDSTWAS